MSVTILDIATQAGTSKSTVSRFLNGESISVTTAERIRHAIHKTGYSPNVNARRLVKSCSKVLGVVFDDISNYTYGGMLDGVQRAAQGYGYDCLFLSRATDQKQEKEYLQLINSSTVDGLIFATLGQRDPGRTKALEASGLPIVLVGSAGGNTTLPVVDVDNKGGTRLEINHLTSQGHRRIVYLEGPAGMPASASRKAGYLQALEDNGLPADPALIVTTEWNVKEAYQTVRQLLRDARFTAVVASNAYSAYGAFLAVVDAGSRVPQDIAVAGFDDDPLCEHTRPGITTLRQPFERIGQKAVELLVTLISHHEVAEKNWQILPDLIIRGSTVISGGEVG